MQRIEDNELGTENHEVHPLILLIQSFMYLFMFCFHLKVV